MPQRKYKALEKFPTEDVQGEGSWVEMARPTYEDLEMAMDGVGEINQANQMAIGKKLLMKLVKAWNWVDDDGEDMPQPTAEIVSGLPMQETIYLVDLVKIDGIVDQKKSPGK